MSAVKSVRPGNRKRAMAHAAAMPKTRFNPTATGATIKVSFTECKVSGSWKRLSQYARTPWANAWTKTFTSGTTTKNPMMTTAVRMRATLTAGGSSWGRGGIGFSFTLSAMMSFAPAFEQVDREERHEGDRQDDDRDRRRFRVGELLQPRDDENGRDLGLEGHVARDEDDGAVLAERAREGERKAGDERREDGRQDHPDEGLQPVRSQAGRRLLRVLVEPLQHRLERADHEGEPDEDEHEHDPQPRVRAVDPDRDEEAAVPAARREEVRVDEPRHRRGEREGEIDEGVEEALQREVIPYEHPGDEEPEDRVDQRRRERGTDGEEIGGHGAVGGDGGPELAKREVRCLQEAGRERDPDQQAHVEERVAEAQRETRQHAAVHVGHDDLAPTSAPSATRPSMGISLSPARTGRDSVVPPMELGRPADELPGKRSGLGREAGGSTKAIPGRNGAEGCLRERSAQHIDRLVAGAGVPAARSEVSLQSPPFQLQVVSHRSLLLH